jgi:hypothetical protein
MLAERITSMIPELSSEILRWFLDRDYAKPSTKEQDWDLVLADWKYVPLLIEYAKDPANLLEKRLEAFSALMVLQAHREEGDAPRQRNLNQEIKRIVLAHPDFAREASTQWLGLIESLTVKTMLGEEIPADVPQALREEIARRA